MAILRCPFHVYSPGEPPRPMLPVRITNPATGLYLDAWALIDTGADDCALPAAAAARLGHRLTAGRRKRIGTGNGTTWAYTHTTCIEIHSLPSASRRSTLAFTIPATPIDFLPRLDCILLGVNSFLSRFVLKIDYPKRCFSIRTP